MPPLAPVTRGTRPDSESPSATDLQRVHDEDERGVARDRRRPALRAVRQLRRNGQLTPPAGFDANEALVPALDHHALAKRELERLALVPRVVELGAVLEQHAD